MMLRILSRLFRRKFFEVPNDAEMKRIATLATRSPRRGRHPLGLMQLLNAPQELTDFLVSSVEKRLELRPCQARRFAAAGMETSTLQPHLASRVQPDTGEKRLCALDESSLASIRQMHDFIDRRHCNDRVLLVGDSRQHEAAEAGRPFAQLQEVERVGGDERFAGNAVVAINRDAFNSPHL
jgi:hypothetical protein